MARFPYLAMNNLPTSLAPRLPLTLIYRQNVLETVGLIDSGASVNVIPYSVGIGLGANWDEQTIPVKLSGALGQFEARVLIVLATHPQIIPNHTVELAFAWVKSENVPVIFGQMNFFLEFDICFYRSKGFFEVNLKS